MQRVYCVCTDWCRSVYGQGVRTLRAALNVEAKKKDPKFMRKDLNYSCYFALTKVSPDKRLKNCPWLSVIVPGYALFPKLSFAVDGNR